MFAKLHIQYYVVWFPYGKYKAGKEKLNSLQNVLCQTSRMQRIWSLVSLHSSVFTLQKKAVCHVMGVLCPLSTIYCGQL